MDAWNLDLPPTPSLAATHAVATFRPVIRNIIFDWSGTLVDDLPAVWQASNHALQLAGVPPLTLDQFRAEFSLPFKPFYDRHVPHVALEQLEGWFHARFRQIQDSVLPLPHAREFLVFCRERRVRTFVLSTVHPDHFAVQQSSTGFGEFLERPYLDVRDKRERIHGILAENNLAPGETLFIGDMQHDIETARHGGIASCAVLTGYQSLDQLRAVHPDLIVEHLGELRRLLQRHGMKLHPPPSPDGHLSPPPIPTVGALIFDPSGRVLMVRTHKWSGLWGIPGGKIKFGERSEDALRRELLEETQLEIHDIQFVLAQDCIRSPEFYREEHFILLNYTCRCAGAPAVRLNEEAQEFRWLPLPDAFKLPLNQPTRILLEAVASRSPATARTPASRGTN